MQTPLVFAITVNWNRFEDTSECLDSLLRQTLPGLKILLVDNGSQDGSPAALAQHFPQIELLANRENLGFSGGYNAGISFALQAGADYIFIINNDAIADPECLLNLMRYTLPEAGILAPLIYYHASPERIWSAGGKTNRYNLERVDAWMDRADPGAWPAIIEQDFVTGCAMLFSRRTLETVGLFDEKFYFYYEDSDLCLRVRRQGYKILLIPAARVWHKVAASSGGRDSQQERYWMARSSVRYFRKHARGIQVPVVLAWRTGSALKTSLRLLAQKKPAGLKAYWRGLSAGLSETIQSLG